MLNWAIMSGNHDPFYGEVDTCHLVNRHRDDHPHFTRVTKQPLGWEGLLAIYQTLFDSGLWVRDERHYMALPVLGASLSP